MSQQSLLKNSDWGVIVGEVCRATEFTPLFSEVKEGKVETTRNDTPYTSIILECPKIASKITGFITHKTDFAMLWAAFKEPTQVPGVHLEVSDMPQFEEDEHEVLIVWSDKRYKRGLGLAKGILPRLTVMASPKGAYELITNPNTKPELTGTARAQAELPYATWTPEVVER